MILGGGIGERGVRPPEQCVPVAPFLAALAERGLRARIRRRHGRPSRQGGRRTKG
jgi:hypothetical protein